MKIKGILGLAGLALGAALMTAAPSQAKVYKWITFKPEGAGDAQAVSTKWLVKEFAKRTGGKDQIQVFWGGSVAKTKEIPDALASGVGDFGDIITPYFPDRFPLNNAVGFFIPQPNSTLQIGKLMEKWYAEDPQFQQEMEKQGIHVFGFRPLEDYGLLCSKPVHDIKDMKGLRIRSYGFAYPALIKAMGATPVTISTAEAYEALQRHIIDCTPIGPALARGWKYDEVAKYYIEIPFGASFGHLLAMNLDSYKAMSPDLQKIVDQLGKDYLIKYNDLLTQDEKRVRQEWKGKLGVTVIPFPKKEMAEIVKDPGIQSVRKEWMAKASSAGLSQDQIDQVVKSLQF
ncbi:TRAP transporter substrate-binding protein DctP [Acidimangrovimonas sediminis]|uniref:TRAP transporter substrate-binding protein DctP n=1 Tax=Acidimangrovimonas sediminis TaxID=2056283 RepID=UPI0013047DEF|nr:TRAP transporter substrate-binding protein DctP [Acidimangrovimonas sediminis]